MNKIINITKKQEISKNAILASSFLKRLKGLMFTKELEQDKSMYIDKCNQIHTFFMNYNIDVLYLDKNNTVIHIDESLRPGKVVKKVVDAVAVLELQEGKIKSSNIEVGDVIEIF